MSEMVVRPWGSYMVVAENAQAVKILKVSPWSRLSLQKHERRSECWTALTEGLMAVIGDSFFTLVPYKTYLVDVGQVHRIINFSREEGIIVETIHGEYDEDDIVRLEDDFGRDVL